MTRAAVVLAYPGLQLVETSMARCPTTFPYVPGLLAFRELPAVLAALARLKITPDFILCDGQGIAHPRRFGLASHLGVLLDVPTIGAVVRTRAGVKPVYVSIGHRVCLNTAIELTLACVTRYRLPETTRHAHHLASAKKDDA